MSEAQAGAGVAAGAAATAGAAAPLSAEWQDRLAGGIVRGETDQALLTAMIGDGFAEAYARVAIAVVRSMTARVQAQNPELLEQYLPDPIRIPAAAQCRAADREISVRFTLVNPNLAVLDGVLTDTECEQLIRLANNKVKPSEVIEPDGRRHISQVRTSEGTYFAHAENAIVDRLERRLAALIGKPVDHAEPLQILHYLPGGEYLPHHDYFVPKDDAYSEVLSTGGQRVATMIVYLNQVAGGGETVFPELELTVRPRRGSAVYFEYCNGTGDLDSRLLHAGCPVSKGEKWIATKWIRQRTYRANPA